MPGLRQGGGFQGFRNPPLTPRSFIVSIFRATSLWYLGLIVFKGLKNRSNEPLKDKQYKHQSLFFVLQKLKAAINALLCSRLDDDLFYLMLRTKGSTKTGLMNWESVHSGCIPICCVRKVFGIRISRSFSVKMHDATLKLHPRIKSWQSVLCWRCIFS
mgnify:CR=1 FL=1